MTLFTERMQRNELLFLINWSRVKLERTGRSVIRLDFVAKGYLMFYIRWMLTCVLNVMANKSRGLEFKALSLRSKGPKLDHLRRSLGMKIANHCIETGADTGKNWTFSKYPGFPILLNVSRFFTIFPDFSLTKF